MLKILKKLPRHVYLVLVKPERFFKKIVVDGSLEEPMVKSFIYGFIGGLTILVLGLIGGGTLEFYEVFVKLVLYPLVAVGIMFAFAGLMMMFSEITNGTRDWELSVKAVASIFFIFPIILILNSLAFSCWSLWLISLIIDSYVIFLIYNITLFCMGGKKWGVLSVVAAMVALMVVIYGSSYRTSWITIKNPSAAIMCIR